MAHKPCEECFYIDSTSGLNTTQLVNVMVNHGMHQCKGIMKCKIGLRWIDGMHANKKAYEMHCVLSNALLGHNCITSKYQLSKQPALQAYIMPTWEVSESYIPSHEQLALLPWIIRPDGGFSGKGITVIDDVKNLPSAIRTARAEVPFKARNGPIIASQYIVHPALFEGKKFHFRRYMVIAITPAGRHASVWHRGDIFTAGNPYVADDYSADVRDTHGKSTDRDIDISDMRKEFPDDYERIMETSRQICMKCAEIAVASCKPFPESKYGFEILAADFMLTEKLEVILIEVNDRVGFSPNEGQENAVTISICHDLFVWLDAEVFSKVWN